jgi:hypothetical protein
MRIQIIYFNKFDEQFEKIVEADSFDLFDLPNQYEQLLGFIPKSICVNFLD